MTRSAFRFGLVVGRPASGAAFLAAARTAERLGYDLLLAPDTAFTPSPFPALAAAGAVTSSLRVAPWVLAAPLREPAAVVREAAALQLLTGGRFELGVGTGRPGAADEAVRLGRPWGSAAERLRLLEATVDAVRRAVEPAPRVIVAASGPRALAVAGTIADTVALAVPATAGVDEVAATADRIREHGDPELALALTGVGGRPVSYLARADPDALAGAATLLRGDATAMAEQLAALSAATGATCFPVAEEHAEAFAPVLALLRS